MKLTQVFIKKLIASPKSVLDTLSEDEVAEIIQKANHSYYHTKKPLFSDNIFDLIKDYLEEKNPNHPILKNVGAVVSDKDKVRLPYFMGSLDKIKDEKSIQKFVSNYGGPYLVSDKLDGNSGLFVFNEKKAKLYSRGDGTHGQDISHLLPFLKSVPQINKDMAVRGEIIITKKNFEKLTHKKQANARNMVAGLINSKTPDLEIAKHTEFVAYEVIYPVLLPDMQMSFLKENGFNLVAHELYTSINIEGLSKYLVERRNKSPYEIDGIVISDDKIYKRLPENPSHSFAFKSVLTMEEAEVIVNKVEWNVSKDGYMVPVITFNPVQLDGVSISRTHGFNAKFIKDNVIGPGSKIIIIRSGAVIPYCKEVLSPSETGEPDMPDISYEWSSSSVDIVMSKESQENSEDVVFKNIEYFFNKLDVKGLSTGNLKKIFNAGHKVVKDILDISVDDLKKIDGFKDKMAQKIYDAMQEAKKDISCVLLMDASNTLGRGMGAKKIELVLDAFPKIVSERYVPTVSEMITLKGIEKKTAELFITNLPKYFAFVDKNKLSCYMNKEQSNSELVPDVPFKQNLVGHKIVFTGFRDDALEDLIKKHGGVTSSGVSKTTTIVVCKDVSSDSSKITKGKEVGAKIMSIVDFKSILTK